MIYRSNVTVNAFHYSLQLEIGEKKLNIRIACKYFSRVTKTQE